MKAMIHNSYYRKHTYLANLLILVALSGCHPCSLLQCESWITATAHIGKNNELIIDIPEKYKNKYIKIQLMSIRKLNGNVIGSNSYWSIGSRAARNIYEKTNDFPIKYGHLSEYMKLDIAPVKITNGTYTIIGAVVFPENSKINSYRLNGKFKFSNNSIENIDK
ncbi:hypothetical protein [Aquitalea sp. ASV11]|uniref:hypothetical protein n=1 Tax=Aquitalea sp. ASV11 TaxID=2795103 RepID=UPI0018ED2B73|nr:hypothetical protein [Aquitalea sp. ASV11]